MDKHSRKSIFDDLRKYCYLAKEDDFIEITEWTNGEGWDISINDKIFNLTDGQLRAINYLTMTLELNYKND
jgi:hypothetical protein